MPPGVVGWDKAKSRGTEVRKGRSVWSTDDCGREEGKPQLVFCCRAENETWILDLEE